MKKVILTIFTALFLSIPAHALDVVGGGEYLVTPNGGNNYTDAYSVFGGVKKDITDDLSVKALLNHITDVGFPSSEDVKGRWGEMRGYGPSFGLEYSKPINERANLVLGGEVGYFWWDFKENPFLQDNGVIVDLESSVTTKVMIGVDYQVSSTWNISVSTGWFQTKIGKYASNEKDGEWHILDDSPMGIEYIPVRLEAKTEF